MKKILMAIIAVVCCASLVIAGVSLAIANNLSQQVEKLSAAAAATYNTGAIDNKFDKLWEELNLEEFNFELGDHTYWYDSPVRQAQVKIAEGESLVIPEKLEVADIIFTKNMTSTDDGNSYTLVDPSKGGTIVIYGVDIGYVIINVIIW